MRSNEWPCYIPGANSVVIGHAELFALEVTFSLFNAAAKRSNVRPQEAPGTGRIHAPVIAQPGCRRRMTMCAQSVQQGTYIGLGMAGLASYH